MGALSLTAGKGVIAKVLRALMLVCT